MVEVRGRIVKVRWIVRIMGVSKNKGKTPKWMVKIRENPMNKWMIWGETPLLLDTPICTSLREGGILGFFQLLTNHLYSDIRYPPKTSIFLTWLSYYAAQRVAKRFVQGRLDGGAMQGADATVWDSQRHLLGHLRGPPRFPRNSPDFKSRPWIQGTSRWFS